MGHHSRAKARGSAAERELLHKLYDEGYGVVRAAGSGSTPIEAPDVIAGKNGRILAIEIKYCNKDRQYISTEELTDLNEFSFRFGAEAWIAVKFTRRGWFFIRTTDIPSSGKNYVLSYEYAQEHAAQIIY